MESDHLPKKRRRSVSELDEFIAEHQDGESGIHRRRKRGKRQAPYIIFPEILCIVDYDGYR